MREQPPTSPEVFSVVDCDEAGARWDYNYKVRSLDYLLNILIVIMRLKESKGRV